MKTIIKYIKSIEPIQIVMFCVVYTAVTLMSMQLGALFFK